MTRPGGRLRALSARLCAPRSVERFIDPAVADLQYEHADAWRRGAPWRARWLHVAGTCRVVQALSVCLADEWWRRVSRAAVVTPVIVAASLSLALCLALAAMLMTNSYTRLPLAARTEWPLLLALLMPASIPVTLPCGACVGAMLWQRRRGPNASSLRRLMMVAWACVIVMLVVVGWVSPETNQMYRIHVTREMGLKLPPVRGANELSFPALLSRARCESMKTGFLGSAATRETTMSLHGRLAVSFSPVLFALLGAYVARGRRVMQAVAVAVAYAAFAAMYAVPPERLQVFDAWQPEAVAWLPDGIVAVAVVVAMYASQNVQRARAPM